MSDLDFYAHVATSCDVFGTGIGSSPAAWEATVGPDYLDDPSKGTLRRDYGLVELSFSNTEGPMSCFGISVQVHRLIHGLSVPASLAGEYGEFAPRARFADMQVAIQALGYTVEPDDLSGHVHRYRVPRSGARIFVINDPDPYGDGDHDVDDQEVHQAGDVWALSVSPAWWRAAQGTARRFQ
ncbi:hypothetical protein [Streptomyces lancefieldiae]|uniref:Uncharacterized protein n=1 Tax=Streptomyces lancefieldiae TaxID=3075520 RepID=A0ABU3AT79_9ACTN|nr:hypothetical protein [Streptomyces sp. DSM 40712]MDT0613391.1 hypothetical protein [Streptomyces sp. DSM 40712]